MYSLPWLDFLGNRSVWSVKTVLLASSLDEDVMLFVGGENCIASGVRVVVVVLGRLRLGGL